MKMLKILGVNERYGLGMVLGIFLTFIQDFNFYMFRVIH